MKTGSQTLIYSAMISLASRSMPIRTDSLTCYSGNARIARPIRQDFRNAVSTWSRF
jgi:hypothetical protein